MQEQKQKKKQIPFGNEREKSRCNNNDKGRCRFLRNDNQKSKGYDVLLFVLRGFEEGIVLGAADHFVEGGAGGDHGVDAVFFFYLEVY